MKPLLILLLLTAFCFADKPLTYLPTLVTTKGVTYKEVKISRCDASELRFIHDGGAAVVPLHELPEELQKTFGYDPVSASFETIVKQEERRKSIIQEADKKARNYAIIDQQQKDAVELQTIRSKALRCSVSHTYTRTAIKDGANFQYLMADVLPVEMLPVMVRTKSGHKHIKVDGWGKPELTEQVVRDKGFILGSMIRIVPSTAAIAHRSIITVYLVDTMTGFSHTPICALTPEDAFKYRRKIAADKTAGKLTEASPED